MTTAEGEVILQSYTILQTLEPNLVLEGRQSYCKVLITLIFYSQRPCVS